MVVLFFCMVLWFFVARVCVLRKELCFLHGIIFPASGCVRFFVFARGSFFLQGVVCSWNQVVVFFPQRFPIVFLHGFCVFFFFAKGSFFARGFVLFFVFFLFKKVVFFFASAFSQEFFPLNSFFSLKGFFLSWEVGSRKTKGFLKGLVFSKGWDFLNGFF